MHRPHVDNDDNNENQPSLPMHAFAFKRLHRCVAAKDHEIPMSRFSKLAKFQSLDLHLLKIALAVAHATHRVRLKVAISEQG